MKFPVHWPFHPRAMDKWTWKLVNAVCIAAAGLTCKVYLECLSRIKKYNTETLLEYVEERSSELPLVTVCNHSSCIDDPLIWGILNWKIAVQRDKLRWTLGASELLFSNTWNSFIFSRLKVIPVLRGDGVYQKGMEFAIEQLNRGKWIHVFPEGGVNATGDCVHRLKWGVGRLIAEANVTPVVVPFWHKGMDDVLPNKSPYIPKLMQKVTVLVGEPMNFNETVEECRRAKKSAMETRKHITDIIHHRFKELKDEADMLHSKWR